MTRPIRRGYPKWLMKLLGLRSPSELVERHMEKEWATYRDQFSAYCDTVKEAIDAKEGRHK